MPPVTMYGSYLSPNLNYEKGKETIRKLCTLTYLMLLKILISILDLK